MADSEVRQKFEEVARQILSGGITRAPAVNLFDRNPHYPDEYKFRDVQVAWKTYLAGMRAGEIAMKEKAVNLLEAETYHSAYAAEIQSAIRALPAAPEEKKPALSGAEESKK